MRRPARLVFGALLLLALGFSGSAGPSDYPVLFVHEYCSASSSWDAMFQNLSRRRYGNELVRLYQEADGAVVTRGDARPQSESSFAIDFFDAASRTFTPATVANVSIRRKAEELKRAIDYIKSTTGHARVIVVGHGMGGLVGRAYIQGLGAASNGTAIPYTNDVAGLITIGTPHLGSDFSTVPADWDSACAAAQTVNRLEMAPGGGLLENLNQLAWPAGTRIDTIASYYSAPATGDSDGLVTRSSQDLGSISGYWARHSDAHAWSQPLSGPRLAGHESLAAHSAVIRTAPTAAMIDGIVREIDLVPAAAIVKLETTGLPESAHPYANNFDSSWSYTLAGNPSAIDVKFDPQTFVEWDYDFIYVMSGDGTQVAGSPFTGNDLGGRTLRIQGSTVRIRLTSDVSDTRYGFKLASVDAATGSTIPQTLPESSHPYANNYYGTWVYFVGGNPSSIDVTFSAGTYVEKDYDFIYITDSNYESVPGSPFTGDSLAGKTIRVPGSGVWIELETDESRTDYGFRVTAATAAGGGTTTTTPLTMAEAGPLMANTVAAMIKGALEGSPSAANSASPPGVLDRIVELISPTLYAQSAFTRNCSGGGSVRISNVSGSGSRYTLSNSSATFTNCRFHPQRTNAMNGVLTLNGAWCPGQSSCSGPGISNPSTPIRTTGNLDVTDLGSVPFIGDVGSTTYSYNLGCSGCIFQGSPDTPPTPNPNTCTATVTPTSFSVPAGGGGYSVSVRVGSTCPWTAASNSGFITVTGGSSGRGDGTASFSVSANTSTSSRTGSLSIAGRTVSITQSGATPPSSSLNVTGNWSVSGNGEVGTMTLSQSGSSVTGSATIPPAAGMTVVTNRVTGSVSGSTVNLAHALTIRISAAGTTTTCAGTTNYVLQGTSSRLSGTYSGSASCTHNIPGVPQPPSQSVSGNTTFTKQ